MKSDAGLESRDGTTTCDALPTNTSRCRKPVVGTVTSNTPLLSLSLDALISSAAPNGTPQTTKSPVGPLDASTPCTFRRIDFFSITTSDQCTDNFPCARGTGLSAVRK